MGLYMKQSITKPRGTIDYWYQLDPSMDILIDYAKKLSHLNGYYQVETPIFESIDLFIRTSGNSSDIVTKEMYDFYDKNERKLALRPEMTASVCRSIVENKLLDKMSLPIKLFYVGPMFRYERPQSGRLRQFYQFGVECIESNSYLDDVEMIVFALSFLHLFNYKDYVLKINNICSQATRKKWINALKEYFKKYKDQLSNDSLKRLEKNPLRILDDKIDGKKDFVKNAPKVTNFASNEEIEYFKKITHCLDVQHLKYVVDETLVRGLDYYCNFVFEVVSTTKSLQGQSTLIGGGRYNNLIKEIGGKDTNCVGFAIGLDRLVVALKDNEILNMQKEKYLNVDVVIASLTKESDFYALILSNKLKQNAISCLVNFNTNKIEKHFKYAQNQKAKFIIIIGKKELEENVVILKNQKTMEQVKIKIENLIKHLYDELKIKI